MKKHERIAGLFFTLVGIATALHAWQVLKMGTWRRPDSGAMPFLAAAILTIFSVLWILGTLRGEDAPRPFWEKRAWVGPLLALGLMIFYAWAIPTLGYLASTLAFMLAWQFIVERERWPRATIVSVAATAVMWVLFTRMLGVPLPEGFLAQ